LLKIKNEIFLKTEPIFLLTGESYVNKVDCPTVKCAGKQCMNGFLADEKGCPTCECNKKCPPLASCHTQCLKGYALDDHECPLCKCQNEPNGPEVDMGQINLTKDRLSCQNPGADEDEWIDQCRRCICKDGLELCSLLSCPATSCEHPVFLVGECCPQCPGELLALKKSVQ